MMVQQKNFNRKSGRIEVQKLTVALFLGFCVVLMTYLISTQPTENQQKITVPYKASIRPQAGSTSTGNQEIHTVEKSSTSTKLPVHNTNTENSSPANSLNQHHSTGKGKEQDGTIKDMKPPEKPVCDLSNIRSDICDMEGDVRVHGKSYSVVFISNRRLSNSETNEWNISAYARKGMEKIPKVTVKLLSDIAEAPSCTINYSRPAIVFANGGFTGNYFHDFTDILVPLFATVRQFNGEVQFVVNNIQRWWLHKYQPIMKGLSRYEIIDFDHDDQVHCFPHVIVGMYFYNEMTIDPRRAPHGLAMTDFTKFMRTTYSLPRDLGINLKQTPDKKPRLLIIARHGTRKFTNVEEIAQMAAKLNFEVVVDDASFGAQVSSVANFINSFDVMMGVHGAGLTNFVFLPTNAVLIQIVPWGRLENMCKNDFGFPSIDAKLHYLQYSICEDESTLIEQYPRDHAVFVNPRSIHDLGWVEMGKIYLVQQNVKIDINRFRPVLQEALHKLSQ